MILPVVKLGTLALRTICKPIASRLKKEASRHARFRQFIINLAQVFFFFFSIHSLFISLSSHDFTSYHDDFGFRIRKGEIMKDFNFQTHPVLLCSFENHALICRNLRNGRNRGNKCGLFFLEGN